jgi:hypothetical protein
MSHTLRIKHLEESCRVLGNKIEAMENSPEPDQGKLTTMYEHKESLNKDLIKAKKQQHEYMEIDDDL